MTADVLFISVAGDYSNDIRFSPDCLQPSLVASLKAFRLQGYFDGSRETDIDMSSVLAGANQLECLDVR